ncbi:MAG TPA: sulfatase-like hydrolase/transferase, partial [Agriterribacter sp.]|nr:sulfatase-like hydrolase/transferase [Agriterribacter sp.]
INKLAAQGMRFTQFYAAQAVCSASRAALLTGCYPNRIGIQGALFPWSKIALNPEEETIAELLKAKGYKTGMVGKWHLGQKEPFFPLQQGFDEWLGLPYSNDMWPVNYDGKPITDTADRKSRYPPLPLMDGNQKVREIKTLDDQATLTGLYTERAKRFIQQNKARPFFLYFAHSMPHVPIAASPAFKGKSGAGLFGDMIEEVDWSVGERSMNRD